MFIVPAVTTSKYFGTINKCLWFDVPNYRNPFLVEMSIALNQQTPTRVQINNKIILPSNPEFSENFSLSPNPVNVTRTQWINHIPNMKAIYYVIMNEKT